MFISTSKFPFLDQIARNVDVIRQELHSAISQDIDIKNVLEGTMVMDFPSNQWAWESGINQERVGYDLRDGNFSMLALYKKTDSAVTIDRSGVFPKTMSILSAFENPHYIAFNFLHPGTHLKPHTHIRSHHVFHLLLEDLIEGDCEMVCGSERKILKTAGDHVLFDYSLVHETFHRASNVRINLMVDFLPGEKT